MAPDRGVGPEGSVVVGVGEHPHPVTRPRRSASSANASTSAVPIPRRRNRSTTPNSYRNISVPLSGCVISTPLTKPGRDVVFVRHDQVMVPILEEPTGRSSGRTSESNSSLAEVDRPGVARTEMPKLHQRILHTAVQVQRESKSAWVSSTRGADRRTVGGQVIFGGRRTDRRTVGRGHRARSIAGSLRSKHVVGNRREHQLRAAEHLEVTLVVDRAPTQVDETGRRAFPGRGGRESRRHRRWTPR